ncbi:MAG: pallilysin-related adhesin [Treponema sp.]|jgi:hypothetical protein|nr:pallilysin-related adhesin [Treponema sp.]
MARNRFWIIPLLAFLLTAALIAVLRMLPEDFFKTEERRKQTQTRELVPQISAGAPGQESDAERQAWEDTMMAKIALEEGEAIVTVLTGDFDGDTQDEQIIAYRNLLEAESPIYITYADNEGGGYRRLWSSPTAATRPGTLSLDTLDLIGDHSICVLVRGMNGAGEHTLTVFHRNSPLPQTPFELIAQISIDGSISVIPAERSQAYQMGQTRGRSFDISARGRDGESENLLDQLELSYVYNADSGRYEQSSLTRVPGSQVEQARVRELLSGGSGVFEAFIQGLWYYVGPGGTVDGRQYIYFDSSNRELIFFFEDVWQVYSWQNSNFTRYGLYVSTQNVSVTTLKRQVDIELETLNSVRVRVTEPINLKIGVDMSWNGSYRKAASPVRNSGRIQNGVEPYTEVSYQGSIGTLKLQANGRYEVPGTGQQGSYIFFALEGSELLELRPGLKGLAQETYLVTRLEGESGSEELNLLRVSLGATGIQELHEAAIILN